jgi:NADPH:quinone reductase-like Zn-dependent oxidoreductase
VIVGGEGSGKWLEGTDRQLRALVLSPFVSQKLRTWISTEHKEDLEELHKLLEAGNVTPIVDRTFPLSDAPEAIRYLREGRARGKVVISV